MLIKGWSETNLDSQADYYDVDFIDNIEIDIVGDIHSIKAHFKDKPIWLLPEGTREEANEIVSKIKEHKGEGIETTTIRI